MANTLKFGTDGKWAVKNGSALAFNDENDNFKPLPFTFVRDTGATRVNKQGLIEVVPNNEPRIDFLNDSNGALLLEPSRSNLITYSEDLSSLNLSNITINSDDDVSPNGVLNADKIQASNTTSSHYLRLNFTTSNPATLSCFVKAQEETIVFLGNATASQGVEFDLSNGTITSGTDGKIEDYGNGWFRISYYKTAFSDWQYLSLRGNFTSYLGNGTSGVLAWGFQLEEGSYATSYIPTQGGIGTRDAESCVDAGNNQVINSTEGVLYAECKIPTSDGASKRIVLTNNAESVSVRIEFTTTTNQLICALFDGTSTISIISTLSDVTEYNKIAFRYKSEEFGVWVNGVEIGVSTTALSLSANDLTELTLSFTNAEFEGNIKDLRVYNQALTDAELQALTS